MNRVDLLAAATAALISLFRNAESPAYRVPPQGSAMMFGSDLRACIRDIFSQRDEQSLRVAIMRPVGDNPLTAVPNISNAQIYIPWSGWWDDDWIENVIELRKRGALIFAGYPDAPLDVYWGAGTGGLIIPVVENDTIVGLFDPYMTHKALSRILRHQRLLDISADVASWYGKML